MDTPKEIIEKLRKLLRLGESSNIHEAELAMQRAQELATKWKISLAELSEADQAPEDFVREDVRFQKRTFHQRFIDRIINKHFNVSVVFRSSGLGVWYIGKPSDIAFARFVNDYLAGEFPHQYTLFRKTCPDVAHRHTFFWGMYRGLDEKLTEARKATERREFVGRPDAESRYQIVVINERDQRKLALAKFFPKLGKSRQNVHMNNAASFHAGQTAGRNVNIARPIGGGRAAAPRLNQ
jgi:hypothetical protein